LKFGLVGRRGRDLEVRAWQEEWLQARNESDSKGIIKKGGAGAGFREIDRVFLIRTRSGEMVWTGKCAVRLEGTDIDLLYDRRRTLSAMGYMVDNLAKKAGGITHKIS